MLICSSCGTQNPERQRFCGGCGSKLDAIPIHEVRKIITALFCDLVGSTALGEEHDPEVLRPVLVRYFDEMRTTIERHGGRVEKFIGDAIAAVFGLPIAHEDDALRAARAAIEMQERLVVLNEDSPIPLVARIGVTTGEVLVPADDKPIVGDAMNTAARLETAAAPGEVLIGESTYRLIRDAVVTEQVESLELKGKAELVAAYRLVGVASISPIRTRRLDAPMVGRSRETVLLAQAFERAVSDRSCQLFTVLGTAGAGKSRLVEEFLGTLDAAEVLRGRCLPYGDGITYYPVVEAIKGALDLADFDDESSVQERIHGSVETQDHADAITANLAKLLGAGEGGSPEETFWSIRRFFEIRGQEQPLVVVFDDIHWGEETFLDLIEHVADWSRDAQILLLCMARPDLLDERPAWAGGKTNATTISLAPLTERETTELIDHLLGEAGLPSEVRARIAEVAEGNPLFVEEMFRMLIDDGLLTQDGDDWVPSADLAGVSVPPTISALLSARLDRLSNPERQVIERAAIEGRVFHRSAVMQLLSETERAAIDQQLKTLTRKELISPERSLLPGEDAYRFRHLLIRDAAYDRIPKSSRADLHEAFAGWLEQIAGDRIAEQEEIVGYHLECAHLYLSELGPTDDRGRALARLASGHLAIVGERAVERGDHSAASNLLVRAAAMRPVGDRSRVDLLMAAARSFESLNEFTAADAALSEAAVTAAGEIALETRVSLERAWLRGWTEVDGSSGIFEEAERAIPVLEEAKDEAGLARAWWILSSRGGQLGDYERGDEAALRSLEHARRVGDRRAEREALFWWANVTWGPLPVAGMSARLEEARSLAGDDRVLLCHVEKARSALLAMSGDLVGAREAWGSAHVVALDLGLFDLIAFVAQEGCLVEMLAGDPEAAERIAREAYEVLHPAGNLLWTIANDQLAQSLYEQGRLEEAEDATRIREAAGGSADDPNQATWQLTRGKILARRGEFHEAERLARAGVMLFEPTQFLIDRGFSLLDLAEVLRLAGRAGEATPLVEEAIELFERKGNVLSAERGRRLLDDLNTS